MLILLQLFQPFTDVSIPGVPWSSQEKDKLMRKMIDIISDTSAFTVPATWPKLEPLM